MPFALVVIGMVLIITGLRNTYAQLGTTLYGDLIPFSKFALAIVAVGALGYIPELRRFSHWFLALIIIAMVLANKGFFQRFSQALALGPQAPPQNASSGTGAPANATADQLTGANMINTAAKALGAPEWLTMTPGAIWSKYVTPNLPSSPAQPGAQGASGSF